MGILVDLFKMYRRQQSYPSGIIKPSQLIAITFIVVCFFIYNLTSILTELSTAAIDDNNLISSTSNVVEVNNIVQPIAIHQHGMTPQSAREQKIKMQKNESFCLSKLPPQWFKKLPPRWFKQSSIECDKSYNERRIATSHSPPRKIVDTTNTIYFLHIGKAGGTSVDELLGNIFKCQHRTYVGEKHYDYSYIQQQIQIKKEQQSHLRGGSFNDKHSEIEADVITFLRHPVSRAASQFYFSKMLPWAKKQNASFLYQTFDDYLDTPNKTWFQPIFDGESGSDFLTGIFPTSGGHWVASDGKETDEKIYLRQNKTAACLLAAQRLENTTWFGLLEDVDRSMKLLQITLGLDATPVLPRANKMQYLHPTEETKKKISKFVPKDIWLYEYAKRLFEARWNYYIGNCPYVSPELPPLPDFD